MIRSSKARPRWHRPWFWLAAVAATLVPSAGFLGWSYVASPWLSNVLANAGVTVFLLVPAAVYADWHQRALRDVEAKTQEAVEVGEQTASKLEGVRADVKTLSDVVETLTGADKIEDDLRRAQLDELDSVLAMFDQLNAEADRSSLVDVLKYCLENRMISSDGYRASLFETYLHLRLCWDEAAASPKLVVEKANTNSVGEIIWTEDLSGSEVYRAVESIIMDAGQHPALGWILSINAVKQAAISLRFAARERAMPVMNGNNFYGLIEFTGSEGDEEHGWFITETSLFPREHLYYVVAVDRLAEEFWENHLYNKGWYGSGQALALARAIHGIPDPSAHGDQSPD